MWKEWKPLGLIVLTQLACVLIGFCLNADTTSTPNGSNAEATMTLPVPNGIWSGVSATYLNGFQMLAASAGLFWMILRHSKKQSIFDGKLLQYEHNLTCAQDAIVFGFAKLAESRDQETGRHLDRIAVFSTRLTVALRETSKYKRQISSEFVREIGNSAILHDIGKISVPDEILLKAGPLTKAEHRLMQKHAAVGGECIQQIQQRMGTAACFLDMAREIAFYHHECWDGTGYPHRLSGEDIPLAARIVAVADIYDALSSKRIYKSAFSHEKCMQIIQAEAGQKLDPEVVKALVSIEAEFDKIRCELSDEFDDADDLMADVASMTDHPVEKMDQEQERLLLALLDQRDRANALAKEMPLTKEKTHTV